MICHINKPFKIYVVDNHSSVVETESQKAEFQKLKVDLIYSKENSGYAAGNNIGLKKAYIDGCDLFLISNSDILITDQSIDRMCDFSQKMENVGVVGPLIYDENGKQQPIHMLTKLTAIGKIKNMMLSTPLRTLVKDFQKKFVMYETPIEPMKVFGVSGCCFLVTRDCYEKAFPFDENTFLYEEEYILGCKLEEKNIDAYILPQAKVIHFGGGSTNGMSEFSYNCFMRSEQYYLKEYLHSGWALRKLIWIMRKINWQIKYNIHAKTNI